MLSKRINVHQIVFIYFLFYLLCIFLSPFYVYLCTLLSNFLSMNSNSPDKHNLKSGHIYYENLCVNYFISYILDTSLGSFPDKKCQCYSSHFALKTCTTVCAAICPIFRRICKLLSCVPFKKISGPVNKNETKVQNKTSPLNKQKQSLRGTN